MKIKLVTAGTYLHRGKVYQKKDAQGKPLVYTVPNSVGEYLLAQTTERDVPYFARVSEKAPAVHPAEKRLEKGGKVIPDKPKAAAPAPAPDPEPDPDEELDVVDDDEITVDDVDEDAEDDSGAEDPDAVTV